MTLAAGAKLGPYEIAGAIGAGGMGEVSTEAELARREARTYEPASALLDRIRASQARAPHA